MLNPLYPLAYTKAKQRYLFLIPPLYAPPTIPPTIPKIGYADGRELAHAKAGKFSIVINSRSSAEC